MGKLSVKEIRDLGRQIVADNLGGIHYAALVNKIAAQNPESSFGTIKTVISNLHTTFPTEIAKPSRGLFMPIGKPGSEPVIGGSPEPNAGLSAKTKEVDFYKPFAEYLRMDLDEVNTAIALGGSGLKAKWGTPDVVGTYKPLASHLIKFPIEIVSAEIKADPIQPVVAFGQAVAYRLFSTKTYIAMPATLAPEDQGRLEALCMLFGLGLVVFDLNKEAPNFTIRMRAQRFSPDMFYVNEFAERLKLHDAGKFETLFG